MTNDNIITRDEAIDRMKAGLPCESRYEEYDWRETAWADFDISVVRFRKPPEPRRVARDYWILEDEVFTHFAGIDSIHVREVLPGDVVLQRMTEDEAREAYGDWAETIHRLPEYSEVWLASRRALGLLGEGS